MTVFDRPRERPTAERFAMERIAQPRGADADRVSADRQQRHQVAGAPSNAMLDPACRTRTSVPPRTMRRSGTPASCRIGEQHQVGQLVVQARAGQCAQDHDLIRARGEHARHAPARCPTHPSRRVPLDRDAIRLQGGEQGRIGRVEVTDHQVGPAADRGQPCGPAINGHHPVRAASQRTSAGSASPLATRTDRIVVATPPNRSTAHRQHDKRRTCRRAVGNDPHRLPSLA